MFVHELGHFVIAKRAGMRVDEFGLGFPPRIFGIKKGETTYTLNLIPLGGFVKIHGEDGSGRDDPRSFSSKSAGKRALVLAAGVLMNLAFAAVLLSIGFGLGLPTTVNETTVGTIRDVQVRVAAIAPDSPAAGSDLGVGDAIVGVTVNDERITITNPDVLISAIDVHRGEEIILNIQRGRNSYDIPVVPRMEIPENEGAIGIALLETGFVSYPWYEAIWRGIVETGRLAVLFVTLFVGLLVELVSTGTVQADLAGPVGIAAITGQATELGFIFVLQLAVILSINLAILNAVPFPALDGGRLLFLVIEKLRGHPISQKVENIIHTAGFAFLIGLMILVTIRDIDRLL